MLILPFEQDSLEQLQVRCSNQAEMQLFLFHIVRSNIKMHQFQQYSRNMMLRVITVQHNSKTEEQNRQKDGLDEKS